METNVGDMLERAARAITEPDWLQGYGGAEILARDVLVAALDPEDEALVENSARALWKASAFPMPGIEPKTWHAFKAESQFDFEMFRGYAIAMLAALRQMAQEQRDE